MEIQIVGRYKCCYYLQFSSFTQNSQECFSELSFQDKGKANRLQFYSRLGAVIHVRLCHLMILTLNQTLIIQDIIPPCFLEEVASTLEVIFLQSAAVGPFGSFSVFKYLYINVRMSHETPRLLKRKTNNAATLLKAWSSLSHKPVGYCKPPQRFISCETLESQGVISYLRHFLHVFWLPLTFVFYNNISY